MNKTIKIIDLINMILNGSKEMPFEVIYNKNKYKWDSEMGDYRKNGWGECLFIKIIFSYDEHKHNSFYNMIYDEVEIIEEDRDIEPLIKLSNYEVRTGDNFLDTVLTHINERINKLIDKQTEIIDVINEMRKNK